MRATSGPIPRNVRLEAKADREWRDLRAGQAHRMQSPPFGEYLVRAEPNAYTGPERCRWTPEILLRVNARRGGRRSSLVGSGPHGRPSGAGHVTRFPVGIVFAPTTGIITRSESPSAARHVPIASPVAGDVTTRPRDVIAVSSRTMEGNASGGAAADGCASFLAGPAGSRAAAIAFPADSSDTRGDAGS